MLHTKAPRSWPLITTHRKCALITVHTEDPWTRNRPCFHIVRIFHFNTISFHDIRFQLLFYFDPSSPFLFFNWTSVADSHKNYLCFPSTVDERRRETFTKATMMHETSWNTCNCKLASLFDVAYLEIKPSRMTERRKLQESTQKATFRVHQPNIVQQTNLKKESQNP